MFNRDCSLLSLLLRAGQGTKHGITYGWIGASMSLCPVPPHVLGSVWEVCLFHEDWIQTKTLSESRPKCVSGIGLPLKSVSISEVSVKWPKESAQRFSTFCIWLWLPQPLLSFSGQLIDWLLFWLVNRPSGAEEKTQSSSCWENTRTCVPPPEPMWKS